jgi:hypothetical protein
VKNDYNRIIMPATAFDTLSWAKQLEKAGASQEFAEAQVKIFADIAGKSLAFPADLTTLENSLKHAIQLSESQLEKKIEEVKDTVTWRFFAALAPLYLFGLTALAKALHWF